ncbi:DUF883 family protein [Roseateles oligotrophus]|uniref:DUF883 family protein n=1 Tax=Roseateles oligotrophus TaxID=1769250 RepID=A0ABT2YMP3_9BURK|nr:DUF883 family protein [Roseateles oligotrophus]MCV2371333.1 DUF883 family protein [Roseateles oligotrophus]
MPQVHEIHTDKLKNDLRVLIADAEEVLRATSGQAGEDMHELRLRMQGNLQRAKTSLAQLPQRALEQARAAGQATDGYVHENPWKAITATAGIGLLLGMLISRR